MVTGVQTCALPISPVHCQGARSATPEVNASLHLTPHPNSAPCRTREGICVNVCVRVLLFVRMHVSAPQRLVGP